MNSLNSLERLGGGAGSPLPMFIYATEYNLLRYNSMAPLSNPQVVDKWHTGYPWAAHKHVVVK